jgi:hypothetical protein
MLDRDALEAIRDGRRCPENLASIVIPHYQTENLVRLCLRAIRRLTDHPYETIVVDNHSQDGSLDYLRRVGWIRLMERGPETESEAVFAHATAMDVGMAAARGRWLVSFHTDTIARREGWLGDLIARLEVNPRAAALGADKLEDSPRWYQAMKRLWDEQRIKAFFRRLVGKAPKAKRPPAPWYPRSYCAIYRLDVVRQRGLDFQPAPGHPAGELLYRGLEAAGYEAVKLDSDEMHQYVEHVAHATAFLARGGIGHWRGNQKVRGAMRRLLGSDLARELLNDDSLDR